MNSTINSSTGLLLVNAVGYIVGYNKLAQSMLKENLLFEKDINSILSLQGIDYRVEEIESSKNDHDVKNAKCIYLLKAPSEHHEDFYKKILENSHDEIFVTDSSGNTLYCNETFEKNYGVKRSHILGEKFWLLDEADYLGDCPIPKVITEKKEITVVQETKTGKKLVITATPVLNQKGDIEIIVENARDITQLEHTKNVLEKTKNMMEKYRKEVEVLREKDLQVSNELIFNSPKMKDLLKMINRITHIDSSMLILGESGTGKSAFAKYIHKNSHRKNGPFITINCTTIPEHLLESELFGYSGGAFTGAKKEGKAGLVELADGGTLFLDEIGEIPLSVQAKFLELIQERHFTPVGGIRPKKVDIRIISATNCDLLEFVKEKKFREDLYYRLKVVELTIPPLRERPEDIFPLLYFFLNKYDFKYKFSHKFSQECIDLLINYLWPGNVRELQHIVEQIVVTIPDTIIEPHHLPIHFNQNVNSKLDINFEKIVPLDFALENVERELILKAFNQLGSSYKVANALGISQSKASRKLRKYLNK